MAGLLQGDGERGVSQRIARGQRCERQSRADGLFQASSVAQCAHQAVMRFNVLGIGGDGRPESLGRQHWLARGKKVETLL
jgi:hypothetical protein